MKRYSSAFLVFTSVSLLVSCGAAVNDNAAGGTAGSKSADGVAAQQSAQASDDAGSSDDAANSQGPTKSMLGIDLATRLLLKDDASLSASVDVNGCTGAVVGATDITTTAADANLTITFNGGCTGKQQLKGTESIVASWSGSLTAQTRSLQVTDDLTRTLAEGDTVAISTLDTSKPYTFEISASSLPSDGNVTLNISLNEHRVRATSTGGKVFDHNITTDAPVVVTNSYDISGLKATPTSRSITGVVTVHHNIAAFKAVNTLTNVGRDFTSDCTCPSTGTIVQTVTADNNSGAYVRTYAFTGCGEATVTTSGSTLKDTANGSATVTWDDCTE